MKTLTALAITSLLLWPTTAHADRDRTGRSTGCWSSSIKIIKVIHGRKTVKKITVEECPAIKVPVNPPRHPVPTKTIAAGGWA